MNILVTGGTVFASRYTAEYFSGKGHNVYVLNRGSAEQSDNVTHIKADRHNLGDTLKNYHFDAVLDITAYNADDVRDLYEALCGCGTYILISSSAVYPETCAQPFSEDENVGENSTWGKYGMDKISAERWVMKNISDHYIIRPPYLYGAMNNLYREAFVFDCAEADRPFLLPKEGSMPLHFFHIGDMCRFMETLIEKKPEWRIYNVGNSDTVTVRDWVSLCYKVCGKVPRFISADESIPQRSYFPFYDYAYVLDVSRQNSLISDMIPLEEGLNGSLEWYRSNRDKVKRKPLIEFIDSLKKENLS